MRIMKWRIISLALAVILFGKITAFGAENDCMGRVYCRSSCREKQIALTFDDGPHPRYTREILSILKKYNVTATFFIVGVNAENYPEALMEIAESGCEIGNHTYSHTNLRNMSNEEIREEVQKCENVLMKSIGVRPSVFRPPEGMYPDGSEQILKDMGYDVILWSIDTMDWAMNPSSQIERLVMKEAKGGDIILMHDYVSGGNTTCRALRNMIPRLLSQGYEFVTVSQLIHNEKASVPFTESKLFYANYL